MSVEIRDQRFVDVVGAGVEYERLAGGFMFTEGPQWDPRQQRLLFSDIPGNAILQWSHAAGIRVFRAPSDMANGLAWDRNGRLLCCEHATSRVTRIESDGTITVIASEFEGMELNSPNDIVVKRDGGIYFTDPTYGRMEYYGVARAPVLAFRGVYRVEPDGARITLLADDFAQPNGLCFSIDERRLFVNDTERMHIRVFDVVGRRHAAQRPHLGGAVRRRRRRAGRHEDRQRGKSLLLRARRYPCARPSSQLPLGSSGFRAPSRTSHGETTI